MGGTSCCCYANDDNYSKIISAWLIASPGYTQLSSYMWPDIINGAGFCQELLAVILYNIVSLYL